MTLDEEIYKQEEKAMTYKSMGNQLSMNMSTEKQIRAMENYHMSDYHKQLAEWLRELKAYREQLPHEIKETKKRQARTLEVNVANEVYNPYLSEFVKGYICALSFVEGIVAKIIEEENADDDNNRID